MAVMFRTRARLPTLLKHELRFIRTLQAPQQVVFDKKSQRYRVSSAAFGGSSRNGGLSGELEEVIVADGLAVTIMYPSVSRAVGAVTIRVRDALQHGLSASHDPVKTNWYHGEIKGDLKRYRQKLRDVSVELVEIDQKAAARFDTERGRVSPTTL